MYSDPLDFALAPLSDLAVTIHLKNAPEGVTTHSGARATSYFTSGDTVSTRGNHHAVWRILLRDFRNRTGPPSGDHLHPADADYKIMADSVDLNLFAN
jgi:hypothetical protein